MPGLDDRIRRGLEALAVGEEGSFEDVARRKGRARLRRRAQAATLAVAVLAGTTGGVVALTRAFGDLDRDRPAGRVEGSLIAFVSNRDGNDEIYVMREDGTGLRNLTRHPAEDRDPAWSPDGSMIAFASNRHGGRATSIYVMDGDGSNVRRLTRVAGQVPTWSPDGGSIIFYSGSASSEGAFRIDLDDGEMRPFEPGSLPTSPPAWSPDGATILHVKHLGMWAPFPAYCFGTVRGEVPGIYARDVRSGAERLVAEGNCISHAAWSWRDRLMFTQVVPDELEGPGDPGVHTVLVIHERRSGVRDEAAFPCDLLDECQLPRVSGASWSPDGRRAVLGVEDGGDSALYTVRGDGSGWRRITPVDWNASNPDWQPVALPTPVPGPTPTSTPRTDRCGAEPTVFGAAYVDMTGDGRGDGVALTHIRGCPWLLHVRGQQLALHPVEGPGGTTGRFATLKQIDDRPGVDVVIEIEAADAAVGGRLTYVITWRNGRLEELEIDPRDRSGAYDLVLGEIRTHPSGVPDVRFRGVDCAGEEHGTIVVGELIRSSDGGMLLRRRFYEAAYAAFREQPAATRWQELPEGADRSALASQFPELRDEPFSSCGRA